MNDNDNADYYLSRADQEEEAAHKAVNPLAASIHLSLASRYRAKAGDFEECQKLSIVRD